MTTISAGTTSTTAYVATPDTTGTLVLKTGASDTTALTLDASQNATFAGNVVGVLKSGTATAASGTAVTFTGIPDTAKRVTVILNEVSTNGTAAPYIQLGTSSGIEVTGYLANSSGITSAVSTNTYTAAFGISSASAANLISGSYVFVLQNGNTWIGTGMGKQSTTASHILQGSKILSGTLDRVRVTTANGTDGFDAGSINIMWE